MESRQGSCNSKPMGSLEKIRFFCNHHPRGARHCFSLAQNDDHPIRIQSSYTLSYTVGVLFATLTHCTGCRRYHDVLSLSEEDYTIYRNAERIIEPVRLIVCSLRRRRLC